MPTRSSTPGFTIVELLIVIAIIGILAAITVVSYNGVQQKAISASLVSDLNSAANQLKLYQVENTVFPTANDCSGGAKPLPPNICLSFSPGNSYVYSANNAAQPQTFALTATNGSNAYTVTESTPPAVSSVVVSTCPSGFIPVPGSATYGTADFCTMKYAASQSSSTVPISLAANTPWVNITQTAAIANSANVAGCSGCHLITDAEWLTIAKNVLGVASNWSGGAVGSGFIYSGHTDSNPGFSLAADSNDANGYTGTGNSSPSNQRRTLTLSNGEVIWDLSGNVLQWTSGTISTGTPGITGESAGAWKEWTSVNAPGTLSPNSSPSGTNLTGASTWNSSKGVGQLFSFVSDASLRGLMRGGTWGNNVYSGVLALVLYYAPSTTNPAIGFRVSK